MRTNYVTINEIVRKKLLRGSPKPRTIRNLIYKGALKGVRDMAGKKNLQWLITIESINEYNKKWEIPGCS